MPASRTALLAAAASCAAVGFALGRALPRGRRRLLSSVTAMPRVRTVAITGGPCGGKSSAEKYLKEKLTEMGYAVFFAPEIPTLLMLGGAKYPGIDGGEKLETFERHLAQLQLQVEASFIGMATIQEKPAVVFFDRALLDIKAYVPARTWNVLLEDLEVTEYQLLQRYDAVLHMVTAAHGAEEFFTLGNNATRTENPAGARELDARIRQAWANHPKRYLIDNSHGSFDGKLQAALRALDDALHVIPARC